MSAQRDFHSTLLDLGKPIDGRLIQKRKGPGGRDLDYVEWHTVADILNAKAPDWDFQIHNLIPVDNGKDYICHGALTIAGVTRHNVGAGDGDADKGPKSAVSDCIKRCAILFGVGMQLYRDAQQQAWADARNKQQAAKLAAVPDPEPSKPDTRTHAQRVDDYARDGRAAGLSTPERVEAFMQATHASTAPRPAPETPEPAPVEAPGDEEPATPLEPTTDPREKREADGQALCEDGKVWSTSERLYRVQGTRPEPYVVEREPGGAWRCDCTWFTTTGRPKRLDCKHIYGARAFILAGGLAAGEHAPLPSGLAAEAQGRGDVVVMPKRVAPDEGTITQEQVAAIGIKASEAFGDRAADWLLAKLAPHGHTAVGQCSPSLAASLLKAIDHEKPIPTERANKLKRRCHELGMQKDEVVAMLHHVSRADLIAHLSTEQADLFDEQLRARERQAAAH